MTDNAPTTTPDRRPISILLVDDQSLLREGLRTLLELHADLRIAGEAGDGIVAETLVERLRPDVVLMDLRMPRRDGVEATRRIVERWPDVQVLVLTTFDEDELVFRSIEAGAAGYLLKDVGSDALADAVRAAHRGESPLQPSVARKVLGRLRASPPSRDQAPIGSREAGEAAPGSQPPRDQAEPLTQRERDLLRLLGAGATNREIAERLGLTDGTVKNYVSTLLGKTGLRDRTQLAVWAIHHGLG
ncbi:MAG TPA: response regulator transcription factor [Chloroflexota bacterium]|nr:response regulator transcription factor [Chloroflexota bacterium]